jgi:hypothetical protein
MQFDKNLVSCYAHIVICKMLCIGVGTNDTYEHVEFMMDISRVCELIDVVFVLMLLHVVWPCR